MWIRRAACWRARCTTLSTLFHAHRTHRQHTLGPLAAAARAPALVCAERWGPAPCRTLCRTTAEPLTTRAPPLIRATGRPWLPPRLRPACTPRANETRQAFVLFSCVALCAPHTSTHCSPPLSTHDGRHTGITIWSAWPTCPSPCLQHLFNSHRVSRSRSRNMHRSSTGSRLRRST